MGDEHRQRCRTDSAVPAKRKTTVAVHLGRVYFFSTGQAYSFRVIQAIRRQPAVADLPTVMLCHGAEDAATASALSCTPLIIPVDPDELLATIRTIGASAHGSHGVIAREKAPMESLHDADPT